MGDIRVGAIPHYGIGICRGCRQPVPPGRQTWCGSAACLAEALVRKGDPTVVRREVLARDHGVCAACGLDTEQLSRVLQALLRGDSRGLKGEAWAADQAQKQAARLWLFRTVLGARKMSTHLWEADHIVPVSEGGGGCGLEGYRTLCLRCHRLETAELARRRARRRREAGMGLFSSEAGA